MWEGREGAEIIASASVTEKCQQSRGHLDLNQGPLDLQSNALPLSYTPSCDWPCISTFSPLALQPGSVPSLHFAVSTRPRRWQVFSAVVYFPISPPPALLFLRPWSWHHPLHLERSFESILVFLPQPAHSHQDKTGWFWVFSEPQTRCLCYTLRTQEGCSWFHSLVHSLNRHSWRC